MERYRMPAPRAAIALGAALAAVATLTLSLLPARAPGANAPLTAARAPIEVAIVPSRIEVVGVRNRNAASNDEARQAPTMANPG